MKINLSDLPQKFLLCEEKLKYIYDDIEFVENILSELKKSQSEIETEIKKFKMKKAYFQKQIRYFKRKFILYTERQIINQKMRDVDTIEMEIIQRYCQKYNTTYEVLRSIQQKSSIQQVRVKIYQELRLQGRSFERIGYLFDRSHGAIISAFYRNKLLKTSK